MPGPRVASTRPTGGGAEAVGAFTQAFGQVMDAIQAGKQASLLEEQIRSNERVKTAETVGKLVEGMFTKRAAEVGATQAADEQAIFMGDWLTKQGYDGTAFADASRKAYASGKEAPEILARRITSTLFASNPQQLQALVAGISGGGMAPESPALGTTQTPTEGETPPTPTVEGGGPTTEPTPTQAPPPVKVGESIGPTTPEKTTQLNDLIKLANEAVETGDFSQLGNAVTKQTLTKISTAQKAGSTQAQRDAYVDTYMARPEIQAKFEWMFGPTWKQDLMDLSSGTRQARIEAESRMLSSQAQMDRQGMELVIAALKESGDTKRQELQVRALVDVASVNKQGDIDVKGIDKDTRLLVENDQAIQTAWKEIGDIFSAKGENVGRQTARYKQLMDEIARRMSVKPEYQNYTVETIRETMDLPGMGASILRTLGFGGKAEVPQIKVTPKEEGTTPTPTLPIKPITTPPRGADVGKPTPPQQVPTTETPEQRAARLRREARGF